MRTAGIIAEFNPLHRGHEYAIKKTRELTRADYVIIIMSGDFVQRGGPAVCDKYLRTEMALSAGADAVFELPVRYSSASAQCFAEGGCSLLYSTGITDYLCFGSESGDTNLFKKSAEFLANAEKNPDYHKRISTLLKTGMSYPAARFKTVSETDIDCASLMSDSNNILGLEYCLALTKLGSEAPVPITFKRTGEGYHSENLDTFEFASATAIRRLLTDSSADVSKLPVHHLPDNIAKMITDGFGRCLPITEDDFSQALFSKISSSAPEELRQIPGINPDLLNSIIKKSTEPFLISELCAKIKSKAFTYTAVSRALFSILLSTPANDFQSRSSLDSASVADVQNPVPSLHIQPPEYLRLLGFRKDASELLSSIKKHASVPVITKLADADFSSKMLAEDIHSANLYEQAVLSRFGRDAFRDEFRTGVIIR